MVEDMKMVHDLQTGKWELFNRNKDPEELENLAEKDHPSMAGMRQRLQSWERGRIEKWNLDSDILREVDPEIIRELRDLGYVE